MADSFYVVQLELLIPSFPESFVGLASLVTSCKPGVGGKSGKVGCHHFLDALASAHQGDQHEDSPKYAEGSEEASRFIAGDGNDYLFPSIYIYSE